MNKAGPETGKQLFKLVKIAEPDNNKPIVKGRGTIRRDDTRALIGWENEDYQKVNKKLIDYGHKFNDHSNNGKHGGRDFSRNFRKEENNNSSKKDRKERRRGRQAI